MIAMVRFDKGVIHPVSKSARTFNEVRERAFEGSSFRLEEDEASFADIMASVLSIVTALLALIGIFAAFERRRMKNILGPGRKNGIMWCRDVPYNGNLLAANVIVTLVKENVDKVNLTSAMVLRMIQKGALTAIRNAKGKVDIALGPLDKAQALGAQYEELRDILSMAAGDDGVLQEKEFKRWARKNTDKLTVWTDANMSEGRRWLATANLMHGDKSTEAGIVQARNLLGLKKYLSEFTLVSERETPEVVLWQDYLTFATLFGIADKVSEQLKEINADIYRETVGDTDITVNETIYMAHYISRAMQSAIRNQQISSAANASSRGFGGGASFGGGGGFSGGGFGGGSR